MFCWKECLLVSKWRPDLYHSSWSGQRFTCSVNSVMNLGTEFGALFSYALNTKLLEVKTSLWVIWMMQSRKLGFLFGVYVNLCKPCAFISMNDNETHFNVCHTDSHSVIQLAWSEKIFLHIDDTAGPVLLWKRLDLVRRKGVRLGGGDHVKTGDKIHYMNIAWYMLLIKAGDLTEIHVQHFMAAFVVYWQLTNEVSGI